jgi:dTDP-4-amino-4,6-dideoxygalactose transaminase
MRLISLPLFPTMSDAEQDHVIESVRAICDRNRA